MKCYTNTYIGKSLASNKSLRARAFLQNSWQRRSVRATAVKAQLHSSQHLTLRQVGRKLFAISYWDFASCAAAYCLA